MEAIVLLSMGVLAFSGPGHDGLLHRAALAVYGVIGGALALDCLDRMVRCLRTHHRSGAVGNCLGLLLGADLAQLGVLALLGQ